MSKPSVLIVFDPDAWAPVRVHYIAATDTEVAAMKAKNSKSLLSRGRCLLCGGVPVLDALFAPDDSEAWGAPEGKKRLLRPDREETVEALLRHNLSSGAKYD